MGTGRAFAGVELWWMTKGKMNPEFSVELIKNMMLQAVTLAAPILLTVMVIGLAISLFQAVTSIQEQTLTFVPKVLGVVALLVILLPWMLRSLMEFTQAVLGRIPSMVN
jgi:flagellar biosynthetic protein FliQ